jgi:hypothetical protein
MSKRFLLSVLLLVPALAGAAELKSVTVESVDGHYIMHSEVWFATDVEQLYEVLLDYDLSPRFSSVVVEARNVAPDEQGRPQFYSRMKTCLLFFCMDFERTGYIEMEANKFITATVDPEVSDFHYSKEAWYFAEEGDGTMLIYDVDIKPKFWVPPIIGPYFLKRKLKSGSANAIDRIEAIAQSWPDVGE